MDNPELIGWISLGAAVLAIAVTVFFYILQEKKANKKLKIEAETAARKFIQDNSDERDFIQWATIAAGCFKQEKHIRKIYNEFTVLPLEIKVEVLSQLDIDVRIIDSDEWIDEKMKLMVEAISALGLGTNFLYDNAKYFHRAYKYKETLLSNYNIGYDFPDVFKVRKLKMLSKNNLSFEQYIDDFVYCKYKALDKMPANVVPPVDALIAVYNLRSADEEIVTFWMMQLVENVIPHAIRELGYLSEDHLLTDAQATTFEDKYFSILYALFYLSKKKEKSGNGK
ncbi:MAG: hypothetical protein GX269_07830 [Clostridiales bacterium]|nr:hypothetical protein [Clostridiales bacterium]